LLVAFSEGPGYRVVMFEAKGYTSFDKEQLISKVRRLGDLFGEGGTRFPGVTPKLIFVSPGPPPTEGVPWANWMLNHDDPSTPTSIPFHIALPQPVEQKPEVTRGMATSGQWWVRESAWPSEKGESVKSRLPD
jgi:hypothetical protein